MKTKILLLVITGLYLAGAACAEDDVQLRIHLPRIVQVEGDSLTVGSIGVLACKDSELADNAGAVAMGRAPWSREEMVIDQRTILSRLAASGIDRRQVKLSGARQVKVRRKEQFIGADRIIQAAAAFLEKRQEQSGESSWRLVGRPKELVAKGSKDFKLKAQLGRKISENRLSVEVSAIADGAKLGSGEVIFQKVYQLRQVVVVKKIQAGEAITPENAKIRTLSSTNKPAEWVSPYGQAARRLLRPGTVIGPGLLTDKQGQIIVRRGQTVVMRIKGLGFTLSTIGQVLKDGRAGDFIKVRNVDTKRIVSAKVRFDGTVTPIVEEMK